MTHLPTIDLQNIPASWRKAAPPPSGGNPVKVYRDFARRVNHHSNSVVRSTDVAAGDILSRDPAAAHDAVYNQYGRDPVLDGEDQGGVVEITIPADLWDELVATHNITERVGSPLDILGFRAESAPPKSGSTPRKRRRRSTDVREELSLPKENLISEDKQVSV